MKTRSGFVSNSSATSFIITNISNEERPFTDFVIENRYLIDEFNKEFDDRIEFESCLLACKYARYYNEIYKPGESKEAIFGDEHGNDLGRVYDYILREGGRSENWSWRFEEMLR